jgi:disulfide bond formation protein DsbB
MLHEQKIYLAPCANCFVRRFAAYKEVMFVLVAGRFHRPAKQT